MLSNQLQHNWNAQHTRRWWPPRGADQSLAADHALAVRARKDRIRNSKHGGGASDRWSDGDLWRRDKSAKY